MKDEQKRQTAGGSQSRRYTGWMRGEWTVFHTYFCPECGEGYEVKTCRGSRSFGIHYLRCPACDRPVIISGSSIILVGLGLALFCSLLLCCEAELMAQAVLLGFGGFGMFRVHKKWRAKRRGKV
jgi:predicted RNA-binding Zn-ribbon protein involved in translation (DUF1610 family)